MCEKWKGHYSQYYIEIIDVYFLSPDKYGGFSNYSLFYFTRLGTFIYQQSVNILCLLWILYFYISFQ